MNKVTMVSALLLALVMSMSLIVPVMAAKNTWPNKVLGNQFYTLNILGKKDGWDPNGSFDNPDRHTIFVPEDTFGIDVDLYGPDGTTVVETIEDSAVIWMTSGTEFAVLDGDGTDGEAALQIERGKYYVAIAALGKPSNDNKGEAREADLYGWYFDDEGELGDPPVYLYLLGEINIKREKGQPRVEDITYLFEIDYATVLEKLTHMIMDQNPGMTEAEAQVIARDILEDYGYFPDDMIWIFDLLEMLDALGDTDYYFWQLKNSGLKHIQVRFYKA